MREGDMYVTLADTYWLVYRDHDAKKLKILWLRDFEKSQAFEPEDLIDESTYIMNLQDLLLKAIQNK